jgi:mRNA-degrading endonuclease toxin of MazEF toxin-antitoxin module
MTDEFVRAAAGRTLGDRNGATSPPPLRHVLLKPASTGLKKDSVANISQISPDRSALRARVSRLSKQQLA